MPNLYILHEDPVEAARMLCDAHIRKGLVEVAQMMSTSARAMGEPNGPYNDVNNNHKCNRWVQESRSNWDWIVAHGMEMHVQYMKRMNKGHKSFIGIMWGRSQDPPDSVFKTTGLTLFADVTWPTPTVQFSTVEQAVSDYRAYYARKEEAWTILARAQALARAASGRSVTHSYRPVMEWTKPSSRPLWLPEPAPNWRPTPASVGEAETYGVGRRKELDFSIKKMSMDHRKFLLDLATQDCENIDVDVAKSIVKMLA